MTMPLQRKNLDANLLPDEVVTAVLRNRGFEPDSEDGLRMIEYLTPYQAMDYYLTWRGLIGFTQEIIDALDGIRAAQCEFPAQGKES